MSDTTPTTRLELENVTVRFGGLLALNDVSFTVDTNEIVGLIGPNGAGKTTAFNVVCGFVKPTTGAVSFPAVKRAALKPYQLAQAGVARTLQGVGLFDHMTVLENVMTGAQTRIGGNFISDLVGLPGSTRRTTRQVRDAVAMLERLGIGQYAKMLPTAIPYGIAKKVSVARALMTHPSLLLLDEPASGLDENELDEFANLIKSLRTEMSVLLVEHNMEFVMPLVDRLVVLNFGEVIATGTPSEIHSNADVLAAYLGVDE